MSEEECTAIIKNAIKERLNATAVVSMTFSLKDGTKFSVYSDIKNTHAFAKFVDELIDAIKKKTREDVYTELRSDFVEQQGKCRYCGCDTLVHVDKKTNIAVCKDCAMPILNNRHDLPSAFGWTR